MATSTRASSTPAITRTCRTARAEILGRATRPSLVSSNTDLAKYGTRVKDMEKSDLRQTSTSKAGEAVAARDDRHPSPVQRHPHRAAERPVRAS